MIYPISGPQVTASPSSLRREIDVLRLQVLEETNKNLGEDNPTRMSGDKLQQIWWDYLPYFCLFLFVIPNLLVLVKTTANSNGSGVINQQHFWNLAWFHPKKVGRCNHEKSGVPPAVEMSKNNDGTETDRSFTFDPTFDTDFPAISHMDCHFSTGEVQALKDVQEQTAEIHWKA